VGAKKLTASRGVSETKNAEGEKKEILNNFLNAKWIDGERSIGI
jgi:hypothetical protein